MDNTRRIVITHQRTASVWRVAFGVIYDYHRDDPEWEEEWDFPTFDAAERFAHTLAAQSDSQVEYWCCDGRRGDA